MTGSQDGDNTQEEETLDPHMQESLEQWLRLEIYKMSLEELVV